MGLFTAIPSIQGTLKGRPETFMLVFLPPPWKVAPKCVIHLNMTFPNFTIVLKINNTVLFYLGKS